MEYEVLVRGTTEVGIAQPAPTCPGCGSNDYTAVLASSRIAGRLDRRGARFPYYDMGLGCTVRDAAHHRALCAALGVVQTDGKYDFTDQVDQEQADIAADAAAYREYQREITEGPDREAIAKASRILADRQAEEVRRIKSGGAP